MSFNLEDLRTTAKTRIFSEIRKSYGSPRPSAAELIKLNNKQFLFESKGIDAYDIFLSHRSKDADVILGTLEKLSNLGYKVYVDWIDDPQLDRSKVTKETAKTLKERMDQCKSLLYATTINSTGSIWMPWELGYMDGRKNRAAILPIFDSEKDSSNSYKGQEYLGIYPYCIQTRYILNPNKEGLWIFEDENTYVIFKSWLEGNKP